MRPLLAAHEDGVEHEIAATRALLADEFALSDVDRSERIPSGRVTTLQNRVGWAATYLFRAGLLERPRRAHYRITDRGREMLAEHPQRIDLGVLKQFDEFEEFRQRDHSAESVSSIAEPLLSDSATAEERIDAGHRELRSALAADLLDRVREGSWEFFEQLVLDVLKAMGYGGPEGSVERLGGGGMDEGVDGVIREDALGLDLIYVQAKSWQGTVGRPEIQRFFGALHGKRAGKGVFITTSKFSAEAREYAQGVTPRVILVDGRQLAELMVDHNVGVTVKDTFEIKGIDLDYFSVEDGAAATGQ
jgi:restriction system protein